MANNYLSELKGLDLGTGLSSPKSLNTLRDIAMGETAEEKSAGRLEGLASQFQMNTPLTAIVKGLTQAVAGGKRSKAEQERAEKIAAIEVQTRYEQEKAQWADDMKRKLEMHQLAEIEKAQNQAGIDEGLRLAVDYGDGTAISELVKSSPNMQGVLDDTLPDGVQFEGVNFDRANGTLVPYGRDADGNVMYGQGQKWERFASPEFMQQRAQSLYDTQRQQAELSTERAQGDSYRALAEERRRPDPAPASSAPMAATPTTQAPLQSMTAGEKRAFEVQSKIDEKSKGKQDVQTILDDITGHYQTLQNNGGIVSTENGSLKNLTAAAGSSGLGQMVGGVVGTENQSVRQSIRNSLPLLMAAIKNSTGMSSQQMNSNAELQFYMQAATDPSKDIQSNLNAVENLRKMFVDGGAASATPAAPKSSMKDKYGLK